MRKYKNVRKSPRGSNEINTIEKQVLEIFYASDGQAIDEQIETTELAVASHRSHLEAAQEAFQMGLSPDDPEAPKGWGMPMDAPEFRRLTRSLLDLRKFRDKRLAEIRARLEEGYDAHYGRIEQEEAEKKAEADELFNEVMEGADRVEQTLSEIGERLNSNANGQGQTRQTG